MTWKYCRVQNSIQFVPEAVCNFKQQHRSTYQRKGTSGIICCLAKLHPGPGHTEPHSARCLTWSYTFYLEASRVPFLSKDEVLASYAFIAFCSSRVLPLGTSLCVVSSPLAGELCEGDMGRHSAPPRWPALNKPTTQNSRMRTEGVDGGSPEAPPQGSQLPSRQPYNFPSSDWEGEAKHGQSKNKEITAPRNKGQYAFKAWEYARQWFSLKNQL